MTEENRSKIRGNKGSFFYKPTRGGSTNGFGIQQSNNAIGYLSVAGDEDTPQYIQNGSILIFKVDQGLWFQASGCDIDVEYTLEPWPYALSEDANKSNLIHWCNKVAVKKDTIVESPIKGFAALKVTYHGTGILYLAAR